MTFPLPLVPMEHYMVADDRPTHPMQFYVRLRFDGQFDRDVFERSVETARARHPMLGVHLRSKGRKAWWVAAEDARPEIYWDEDLERDVARSAAQIDIRSQVGLQVWLCEGGGRTRLWLVVHHACCDGLGIFRFVEDMLTAYAAAHNDVEPNFRPLRVEQLLDRGIYTNSRCVQWLRWPLGMLLTTGSIRYFMNRPVPLAIPVEAVADSEQSPAASIRAKTAMFRHRFSVEQTEAIANAARMQSVTLNDLLLRDMFLAAQDWLDRDDAQRRNGLLRILVPINLRTRLHDEMPAANCTGMTNIERRAPHRKDPHKMLGSLHWEMGMVKRLRLGIVMLRLVELLRLLTGNLRLMLPDGRIVASCVVSNLGRPFHDSLLADTEGRVQVGDLEMIEVEMVPPIRPLTSAAFGVVSFGGCLTISLLADQQMLGEEGGKALLALFVSRLEDSAHAVVPGHPARNRG